MFAVIPDTGFAAFHGMTDIGSQSGFPIERSST
ncbi:hypothetical protein HNR59_003058 [Aquamicrobium lusatiense]|uniref:Uncharacterized protein n=1 Tax=Aquamicrobium lusatiense TaxID=89772 RepID=A0A7W9VVB5_9HYPH|nr:hypothetical protein [Aquamicrobium lusatiense]